MVRLFFVFLVLFGAAATADADVIVTYTPGTDGGVIGTITGTGTFGGQIDAIRLDDLLPLRLLSTSVTTAAIEADLVSGGVTVGVINPGFRALLGANVDRPINQAFSDRAVFDFEGIFAGTSTYDIDAMAIWNVGTLAFSDMNPGTYSVSGGSVGQFGINFATITVVPEPAGLALLLVLLPFLTLSRDVGRMGRVL